MDHHARHRIGRWLPHQGDLEAWLGDFVEEVRARQKAAPLRPVIEEFRRLIDRDPVVRMLVTRMIEEEPRGRSYSKRYIESVDHLLVLIDEVIGRAPEYNETGLVGVPLNAILDRCMATPAGFAAFRNDAINGIFRKILRAWCDYLSGPDSLHVLNSSPKGWKCASARKSTKIEQFQHKPRERHWGFTSWNDYFTRRFKPGERPFAGPDDDSIVANPCESTPYAIRREVKRQDRFWIKSQPYSLRDMMADDELATPFVGGTVYQAFLDAHNYHRWHSPVSGTVRRAYLIEGTYYSEAESEGEDPEGPKKSQGYITQVAARAALIIEADNPALGLIGLLFVGMAEVSSCVFHEAIKPGARVGKGEEVGYFQFGGSTVCLLFRPGAVADFAAGAIPQPDHPEPPILLLGARLATAGASS